MEENILKGKALKLQLKLPYSVEDRNQLLTPGRTGRSIFA